MEKMRGEQPEMSATPRSLTVTGCCRLRLATFQNTNCGSAYPARAYFRFALSKFVSSDQVTQASNSMSEMM